MFQKGEFRRASSSVARLCRRPTWRWPRPSLVCRRTNSKGDEHAKHNHAARRAFLKISAATAALGLDRLRRRYRPGAECIRRAATAEDAKLLDFFSKSFTRELEESPEFMTSLGMKKRYGEWNDYSDEFAESISTRTQPPTSTSCARRSTARRLSPSMRVSYDIFHFRNEQRVANHPFRYPQLRRLAFRRPASERAEPADQPPSHRRRRRRRSLHRAHRSDR